MNIEATPDIRDFRPAREELPGRTIAITGATGGLGTALARYCAEAGATLVLIGRNEEKLEKLYDVVDSLGKATPAMLPLEQDKAGEAACAEAASLIASEIGGLDMLVHTASDGGVITPMANISHDDWMRIMQVNLGSARLLTLALLPLLKDSTTASVSFLLDDRRKAYWGAYGVSKAALVALLEILADEYDTPDASGAPAISINGYRPGPMRTRFRRARFPGELEEEAPLPIERLGPLLWLMTRQQRALTGAVLSAT
ncbi:MAG: hypothetical protein CSB44_06725 [Gammaproteobacteria bacterium]|nr:MAG: hypothetical protein CSB44_06725 [Gammaproteobacteria bacterium]